MQHVQQKTQKEVEKRHQRVVQQEKKKEDSLKLKRFKEEAAKRKLEYKGLHRPSQASSGSSYHDSKTLSPGGPSLPPDKRGKSTTSKVKPYSSKSSAGSSKSSGEQSSSSITSRNTKHKPGSSKSGDKAATSHVSRSTSSQKSVSSSSKTTTTSAASASKSTVGKPPVVNFNDLMKMAKMNKSSSEEKSQGAAVSNNGKGGDPPRQISSPLGKSLLERTGSRIKGKRTHDEMLTNASKSLSKSNCIDLTGASSSIKAHSSTGVPSAAKSVTNIDRHAGTRAPGCLPSAKASPSKSGNPRLQQNGQSVSNRNSKSQCTTGGGGGGSRDTLFKSPLKVPQDRLKPGSRSQPVNKVPRPKPKPKPVQATAFYGSAAARILKQKDRSSGGAPFRYTSSWVDEMKDMVVNAEEYEGCSGEDEDDLDDFVVGSDDEFIDDSEAGDYSSYIREIFGYDKRK